VRSRTTIADLDAQLGALLERDVLARDEAIATVERLG